MFGTPWLPSFYPNVAKAVHRNIPKYESLTYHYSQIPSDTDILISHGAPMNIMDKVRFRDGFQNTGCGLLYKEIMTRIQPLYHLFGHIWNNYGVKRLAREN